MTPMIPKIRVSPDATRNSSSPYCSALRHWIKKVTKSINVRSKSSSSEPGWIGRAVRQRLPLERAGVSAAGKAPSHLAAAGGIRQRLARDADQLVLLAVHLAQVEVLHR